MGHILEIYDNGNCNGFPFATVKISGTHYDFYPNGNCNGLPVWTMVKTDRYTEVYELPGRNCLPSNYFKSIPPGRWGGAHGAVGFYPNGNGNGIPEYFFSFRSENEVVFYPTGNANGIPDIAYFVKRGRTVYFYPNGNGNGMPTATIAGANDIREVIELVFYFFIPHGRRYRPRKEIRTENRASASSSGGGSSGSSSGRGGSGSSSGRDNADRGRADSGGGNSRESGGGSCVSSPHHVDGSRFRELFDSCCSQDSNGRIHVYDPDDDDDDVDEQDDSSNLDDRPLFRNHRSRPVNPNRVNRLGRRSLHDDDDYDDDDDDARDFPSNSVGGHTFRELFDRYCSIDSSGRIHVYDPGDDDDVDDDVDAQNFTSRREPRRNNIERSLGERIFITLLICLFLGIIIWLLISQ